MPLSTYQQIQQVKDHYNTIGQTFSQTRKKPIWEELMPFIKQVKNGMKILDVGCGNGRLLGSFKGKEIKYTGIDFSEVLIKEAKKAFPDNRFLLRDLTVESDWDRLGMYDVIFCLAVMHHIPDRKRQHDVLQRIYQHLKPGGFAVFSVWNLWQLRFWKYHLSQIKKKMDYNDASYVWIPFSASNGNKRIKTVMRFCKAYLPGEFLHLVKQVGFKIDTYYYASKGKTKLSILDGQNFCLLVRKPS